MNSRPRVRTGWCPGTAAALLLIASFIISSTSPATADDAEKISHTYRFETPVMDHINIAGSAYDRIIIPGLDLGGNPGEPMLPIAGGRLLIPAGFQPDEISVTYGDGQNLGQGYKIAPNGRPLPLSADKNAFDTTPTPDPGIYNRDSFFPKKPYKNISLQKFRGFDIQIVKLFPVRYNPVTGELIYYHDIEVTVTLKAAEKANSLYRGFKKDFDAVTRKIDNEEALLSYHSLAPEKATREAYDYLIITTPELASAFQPLKEYHDSTGLSTVIYTTDDIGSNAHQDVRSFIRSQYYQNGIEYLLIAGDDDLIPCVDLYVRSWEYSGAEIVYDMPGDLYFGCLDGIWNYDGDTFWGEPTDGVVGSDVDLTYDVYVGRAPVGTVEEADNFVNKTLAYAATEDTYLGEALMVGEYLGFGGIGDWGGNYMDDLVDSCNITSTTYGIPWENFRLSRFYERDGTFDNADVLIDKINDGVHFINHLGHGSETHALKLYTTTVYQFTNDKYCLIYSQACLSGHFDNLDCLAEYLTVKTNTGAFAVIMNARFGWGVGGSTDGPSQRFHREFLDAIYNPDENMPQLGKANADSKEDNLYRIDESCMRWCYYEINLFGDPAIAVKESNACTDSDHDLACNDIDNCLTIYNPDQADADSDGVGDLCDNCPNTPNADQADADGNHIGDVCDWMCGDVDDNGLINLLDVIHLIDFKFKDGPAPMHDAACDVDNNGEINLLDIIYLIDFKFKNGPAPDCG